MKSRSGEENRRAGDTAASTVFLLSSLPQRLFSKKAFAGED
jgi:hypothetical protein